MSISSGTVAFVHHAGKVTGRDGMGGSVGGWTGDADGTVRGSHWFETGGGEARGEADMLGAGKDLERISLLLQDCAIPRKARVYLHLIPQ